MPKPQKALLVPLIWLVGACQAQSQPAGQKSGESSSTPAAQPATQPVTVTSAPAAAPVSPAINDLLDRLEKSASDLKAFTAKITYEKEDAMLGRKELRTGEIVYRVEANAGASGKKSKSFAVLFDSLIVN